MLVCILELASHNAKCDQFIWHLSLCCEEKRARCDDWWWLVWQLNNNAVWMKTDPKRNFNNGSVCYMNQIKDTGNKCGRFPELCNSERSHQQQEKWGKKLLCFLDQAFGIFISAGQFGIKQVLMLICNLYFSAPGFQLSVCKSLRAKFVHFFRVEVTQTGAQT